MVCSLQTTARLRRSTSHRFSASVVRLTSRATSLVSHDLYVGTVQAILLTLPSVSMDELDDVRGAVNIQSSEQLGDVCETFQPLKADGVIRGPYDCAGEQDDPQGQGNGNNGGSGSDSDSDSDSAASTRYISGATVVLGVLAAVFGML